MLKAITVVVYVTVLIVEIIMFGTAVKFIKNVRKKLKHLVIFILYLNDKSLNSFCN